MEPAHSERQKGPSQSSPDRCETRTGEPHKARGQATQGWTSLDGSPSPLGVTWLPADGRYNFALYSKHAEAVTLLLYREGDPEQPMLEQELNPRQNRTGRVWHCRLRAELVDSASYYAYRVAGPPPRGRYESHRFDPEKVLLDPYAQAVFFPPAFSRAAASSPGSNAGRAPLGVLRAVERTLGATPESWHPKRRKRLS